MNVTDRLNVVARPVIERLTADLVETDITVALDRSDRLQRGTTSAPIADPRTGVRVGTVTLVDAASSPNPLLLPVARSAAREIEQRLLGRAPARDRPEPRSSRPTLGWNALTDSERDLAELVADGLTNKQAAATLFISRHTVDAHLRSIYRKLDINSRVNLARVVAKRAA